MSDVLASLQIQADMKGFSAALSSLQSFVEKAGVAGDKATNLSNALGELGKVIGKFAEDTGRLKNAAQGVSEEVTKQGKSFRMYAQELDRATEAKKRADAAGVATGGARGSSGGGIAQAASSGGGGMGSGTHSFLSASASGIHVGLISAIAPEIAAVAMAAEMAIGPVASLFEIFTDGVGAAISAANKMNQVRAALHVVGGSASGVEKEMEFVKETAERLALPLTDVAIAYAKTSAAAGNNTVKQDAAKQAFLGVATAARALHLGAGDTAGAIKALTDIMSKNQVMSEELKRQMGNRIPGAIKIAGDAARDMGLNLEEAMTKGLLKGEKAYEFMDKFGKRLENYYGDAAKLASANMISGFQKVQNELIIMGDLVAKFGIEEGATAFMGGALRGIKAITGALEDLKGTVEGRTLEIMVSDVGVALGEAAEKFGKWIAEILKDKDQIEKLSLMFKTLAEGIRLATDFMGKAESYSHRPAGQGFADVLTLGAWSGMDIPGKTWGAAKSVGKFMSIGSPWENSPGGSTSSALTPFYDRNEWTKKNLDAFAQRPQDKIEGGVDKELQALIKRQQEFIRTKQEEIYLQDALGEKTSNYITMVKELVKLKMASVSPTGMVKAGGAIAQGFLAHAIGQDDEKEVEARMKEADQAAKKLSSEQDALLTKVQARYNLESMFPTMQKETLADYQAMITMGAAWIDQKTGQLVLLNNEARITKDIVDERNRQLANDRIAHDLKQSNASLDKNLEQRGKSIQSVSGMEEQAGVLRMNTMIAYSQGRLTLEEYWKEMSLIKVKTDETYRAVEDTITSSVDRVGKGMLDFATKQIKGWTDVRDGVRGMIADILADIAKLIIKLEIEKPLMDYFKGESGSGWLSAFAGIFTGKAAGGNVSAGTPYTVGERGPETFVPGANGSIVPNGAGAGSGSVTIIVSVDNKGNETAPADAQSSANGLSEGLRQAVVQELYNQARTGGYLWKMKHQGAG